MLGVLITSGPEGTFPRKRLPTLKESASLLIAEAVRRAEGNQTIAARLLGISRTGLNKRLSQDAD